MGRTVAFFFVLLGALWLGWAGFQGTSGIDAVSGATGRGRWEPPPPAPVCVPAWHMEVHPTMGFTACVPDGIKGEVKDNDWTFDADKGKLLKFTIVPKVATLEEVVAPLEKYLGMKHVPAIPVEGVKYKWVEKNGRGQTWWQAWPLLHLRFGLLVTARCKGTEAECGPHLKGALVASTALVWSGDNGVYDFMSWARLAKSPITLVAVPGSAAQGNMEWLLEEYKKRFYAVLNVTGSEVTPVVFMNIYQDKDQMYLYTRTRADFMMYDAGEVHTTFVSKEAGIGGTKELAEYLLTSVWGTPGSLLMRHGLAAALDGSTTDRGPVARKMLADKEVKMISLFLAETWEKPDTQKELTLAGAFCRWLLDTHGADKTKLFWQSQDPVGESTKLLGKDFDQLVNEFACKGNEGRAQ